MLGRRTCSERGPHLSFLPTCLSYVYNAAVHRKPRTLNTRDFPFRSILIINIFGFMFPKNSILTSLSVLFILMRYRKGMVHFCVSICYVTLPLFCSRERNCSGLRQAAVSLIVCHTLNMQEGQSYVTISGAQFTKSRCH